MVLRQDLRIRKTLIVTVIIKEINLKKWYLKEMKRNIYLFKGNRYVNSNR